MKNKAQYKEASAQVRVRTASVRRQLFWCRKDCPGRKRNVMGMAEMELLDIVDENGVPTGETAERARVHREGLRHRTAHVWLLRRRGGRVEVLLQKRSENKDSFPGCYDISSAGHIPAGVDYIPSALRELKEELGLSARPEELILCGQRHFYYQGTFYGQPFTDRQVSNIYCLWRDVEPEELTLQESEVADVLWMPLAQCKELVRRSGQGESNRQEVFPHCLYAEELDMLPEK